MQRWFYFIIISSAVLAGCSTSEVMQTETPLPTSTLSNTETPIPTVTITPTETPVPTATLLRMTLDDWKEVFSGTYIGDNGVETPMDIVFQISDVIVYDESTRGLFLNEASIICTKDGRMIGYGELSDASYGDTIIKPRNNDDNLIRVALKAAWNDQQKPEGERKGLKVVLDSETEQRTSNPEMISIYIEKELHPESDTPIMDLPPVFYVEGSDHKLKRVQISDPDNWIKELHASGYNAINIAPYDFDIETVELANPQ